MLISVLNNKALPAMIAASNGDYSCVYQSLCDCAEQMSYKYKQKQVTPENAHKLMVKRQAVDILLRELSTVPKDAGVTKEALSAALEHHIEALQGHEHLLSKKGNNYQLIEQTQGLRAHGDTTASLLQYHKLKNKFSGPDSPLGDEHKKVISALDKKKGLTLEILEMLSADPETTASIMAKLYYEAGVLDPELLTKVLKHEKPDEAADAILWLNQYKWGTSDQLGTADNYSAALKHREPKDAARGICELDSWQLLTDKNLHKILMQEDPYISAQVMGRLNRIGLLETDVCAKVLKNKNYSLRISANLLELSEAGLLTQDFCGKVLEHGRYESPAFVIINLHHCGLSEKKYLDYVFKHEHFGSIASIFSVLKESALRTQGNVYAVISHPDIAKLNSEIWDHLFKSQRPPDKFEQLYLGISSDRLPALDQKGFEACLAKTGYVKKT